MESFHQLSGKRIQERGFAAAGRAHDAEDLAWQPHSVLNKAQTSRKFMEHYHRISTSSNRHTALLYLGMNEDQNQVEIPLGPGIALPLMFFKRYLHPFLVLRVHETWLQSSVTGPSRKLARASENSAPCQCALSVEHQGIFTRGKVYPIELQYRKYATLTGYQKVKNDKSEKDASVKHVWGWLEGRDHVTFFMRRLF